MANENISKSIRELQADGFVFEDRSTPEYSQMLDAKQELALRAGHTIIRGVRDGMIELWIKPRQD